MHYLQDRIWHLYQQIKTGPKSKFGPIFFTKKDDIHRFADRYGRKISMPILRNTRTTNTYQVEFRRFKKSVEKCKKVKKKAIFLVSLVFSRNGARNGSRTRTLSQVTDFESIAYTNFAIRAKEINSFVDYYINNS